MMGLGTMIQITQSLSDDEVELIAAELGREVTIKRAADEEEVPEVFEDAEEDLAPRPPVVTIMGHVDHGKTSLLDAIRETAVVETEAGGITQHIGAYQVDVDGRKVTFLDTPGHEAFTAMRARGAKVTDIAVLVVAADDGVMPQTKESISHARAAEVPIVVAVNKIDLPDSNPDRVKSDLAAEGLQPEDWGGTTQFSLVSAKQKQNLDDLLERILLVADAELELTANPKADASGPIIESRLDVGRGPVATMLVQRGTLRVGDAIVAGDAHGKVRALYDYRGEKVKEARPGTPIEILGFDTPPPAGELARVVENEREARSLAQRRGQRLRTEQLAQRSKSRVSLETLFTQMQEGGVQDLNLILKGDVGGSVEAAISELAKIQHPEVRVNVIHQGVGGITEGDIMLAATSNALVVGFNVRPNVEARQLAEREGVDIRTYRVIYQLTEDIEQALVGMLTAVQTEETIGEAEVRALFKVSRLGTIAGCMVTSGVVRRNSQVRVIRDGTVHLRHHDLAAQALQGGRARGGRGLRVRHPARRLQRREGRRRPRGLRDASDRAHLARRAGRKADTRPRADLSCSGPDCGSAAGSREPPPKILKLCRPPRPIVRGLARSRAGRGGEPGRRARRRRRRSSGRAFAAYSARSAMRTSISPSGASVGKMATPKLAVTERSTPGTSTSISS